MGHEKLIRGTGDPDEGGRVPIQGGSRNLKGVRGGLSGRANPKRAIPHPTHKRKAERPFAQQKHFGTAMMSVKQ